MSDSTATTWTVACQAPLSLGFPRQEYWSGLSFLPQSIFLTKGSYLHLLHWQVDSLPLSHQGSPQIPYISSFYGHSCQYPETLLPITFSVPLHQNPSLRWTQPSALSVPHTNLQIHHHPLSMPRQPFSINFLFCCPWLFRLFPVSSKLWVTFLFPTPIRWPHLSFHWGNGSHQKQTSPTNLPTWYPFSPPLRC